MQQNSDKPLVIFLHGKETGQVDEKLTALLEVVKQLRLQFVSIDFKKIDDPAQCVKHLLAKKIPKHSLLILVGSNMSCHISIMASQKLTIDGLYLVSPSFAGKTEFRKFPRPFANYISIVHSWSSESVQPESIIQFARQFPAELHMLDDEHSPEKSLTTTKNLFHHFLSRIINEWACNTHNFECNHDCTHYSDGCSLGYSQRRKLYPHDPFIRFWESKFPAGRSFHEEQFINRYKRTLPCYHRRSQSPECTSGRCIHLDNPKFFSTQVQKHIDHVFSKRIFLIDSTGANPEAISRIKANTPNLALFANAKNTDPNFPKNTNLYHTSLECTKLMLEKLHELLASENRRKKYRVSIYTREIEIYEHNWIDHLNSLNVYLEYFSVNLIARNAEHKTTKIIYQSPQKNS